MKRLKAICTYSLCQHAHFLEFFHTFGLGGSQISDCRWLLTHGLGLSLNQGLGRANHRKPRVSSAPEDPTKFQKLKNLYLFRRLTSVSGSTVIFVFYVGLIFLRICRWFSFCTHLWKNRRPSVCWALRFLLGFGLVLTWICFIYWWYCVRPG